MEITWQSFGVPVLIFAMAMAVVSIMYLLLTGRKSAALYSLIWCDFLIFVWSSGHLVELMAVTARGKWNAVVFENFAICNIGPSILLFVLFYTKNKFARNKWFVGIPFVISCAFYVSSLTNGIHRLFYTEFTQSRIGFGPIFYAHISYTYLVLVVGMYFIFRFQQRGGKYERRQAMLLSLSILTPFLLNILHVFGVVQTNFDITPVAFSVSMLLVAVAALRYRFLDIVPAAMRKAFNAVNEAIVFLDNSGNVIDCNQSFKKLFAAGVDTKKKTHIGAMLDILRPNLIWTDEAFEIIEAIEFGTENEKNAEITTMVQDARQVYNVSVQPFRNAKGEINGRVISLVNITLYIHMTEELSAKNNELAQAYTQLSQYALTVEEISIVKERNRVAKEIHDTLGHTLILLIKLHEAALASLPPEGEGTAAVAQADQVTREGLRQLRSSIAGMAAGRLEGEGLIHALEDLAQNFNQTGISVRIEIEGKVNYTNVLYSDAIYRACQESITNSVKHGHASEVNIFLKFNEDRIRLYIIDNGHGCKDVTKGFGLTGMDQRVSKLGGRMVAGSDGENGFNIHIEIPIEAPENVQNKLEGETKND